VASIVLSITQSSGPMSVGVRSLQLPRPRTRSVSAVCLGTTGTISGERSSIAVMIQRCLNSAWRKPSNVQPPRQKTPSTV
jgi:hypothetical protein